MAICHFHILDVCEQLETQHINLLDLIISYYPHGHIYTAYYIELFVYTEDYTVFSLAGFQG